MDKNSKEKFKVSLDLNNSEKNKDSSSNILDDFLKNINENRSDSLLLLSVATHLIINTISK